MIGGHRQPRIAINNVAHTTKTKNKKKARQENKSGATKTCHVRQKCIHILKVQAGVGTWNVSSMKHPPLFRHQIQIHFYLKAAASRQLSWLAQDKFGQLLHY